MRLLIRIIISACGTEFQAYSAGGEDFRQDSRWVDDSAKV